MQYFASRHLLPISVVLAVTLMMAGHAMADTFREYHVFPLPPGSGSQQIVAGPDGNLWFTEIGSYAGRIGRITPAGAITEYPVPIPEGQLRAWPLGITAGPEGDVWFSENFAIGRITPTGSITEYPLPRVLPGPISGPNGIAAGPDGNLWFSEVGAKKIGRITPTGSITELALPKALSGPTIYSNGIVAGADGNLWFTNGEDNKIGQITPAGTISEFPLSPPFLGGFGTRGIAAGPDGNLWFTAGGSIGRITPAGRATEFPLPKGSGQPQQIVAGPDGDLWFTEGRTEKTPNGIGRITPEGTITEFPLMAGEPYGIAAGVDGHLWFIAGDSIVRIGTAGLPPTITRASLTHMRFRVARQDTAINAKINKRSEPGTSFQFMLSAPARLTIAIINSTVGLRHGQMCLAPTAKLKQERAERCTRKSIAGTLIRPNEPEGAVSVSFSGRLRHRALPPGAYKAVLRASNTDGRSQPVTRSFVVLPKGF